MKKLGAAAARIIVPRYLREEGYRESTIRTKEEYAERFYRYWEKERPGMDFREIGRAVIDEYMRYLNTAISHKTGRGYEKRTKKMFLAAVKLIFRVLYAEGLLLRDPLEDYEYRAAGIEKRRGMFTEEELNRFLDGIDIESEFGLRDRALFELLYSSGLRVSEAAKLEIGDIDFEERMVLIRQSKFGKDRVVPMNEAARAFLRKLVFGREERKGERVFGMARGASINNRLLKLLKERGLYRPGLSAHSIRHSTATHLLGRGADLRYVQELLGHQSIESTVVYTHELTDNLKRIYRRYHPRENEYAREVDEEYLKRLNGFYEYLRGRAERDMVIRKRKREWYGRRKGKK